MISGRRKENVEKIPQMAFAPKNEKKENEKNRKKVVLMGRYQWDDWKEPWKKAFHDLTQGPGTWERMKEEERYRNDYKKNTGLDPIYPFRFGTHNAEIAKANALGRIGSGLYRTLGGMRK